MRLSTILLLILLSARVLAESGGKPVSSSLAVKAMRLSGPIQLDGKLSESLWQQGLRVTNFTQRDPVEGAQPTEKTEVSILYDDDAIYIGARMYDSHPDSITARLSRRDADLNADAFGFYIDPYLDKRTGYYFAVSAAGTQFDGVLLNDDWDDNSWDGVWESKVNIDSQGWTAEMRIPYSQLRFHKADKYVWGVNFRRIIERKNENDYLVYTPKSGSGFVSRFIELDGIHDITPPRRVELLPYTIGRAEYLQHDEGDPFNSGSKYVPGFGADLKIGFGSNLTLDATVNPDFGQVEVDPAVVNLSDVETFFQEKRPFFIEGSSIFSFGQGGSRSFWGFNWGSPQLFYSRRVGRSPQGSIPDNDYADVPSGTHILGAAKLTGKVGNNWNIGTINAFTRREFAEYQYQGSRTQTEVEPFTYYGVYRAQKDFNNGAQGFGAMSTYTQRFFKDDRLRNEINNNAFVLGLDGWTFLDSDKEYVLTGWAGYSRVAGTKERMTDLQMNSIHYLQRPDAAYLGVDSNATSVSGFAGRLLLNKQKGNFFLNSAIGIIDPKFDIMDAGFIWRTDIINMHLGAGYTWNEPGKIFRNAQLMGALFRSYDFGGDIVWEGLFHQGNFQFLNYYSVSYNLAWNPQTISVRGTRGGPKLINPWGWQADLFLNSDNRKDWVFSGSYDTYRTPDDGSKSESFSLGVEWRPTSNVSVSLSPSYEMNLSDVQWVTSVDDPFARETYGKRYIFAHLNQKTVSAAIRLNWIFTPALSLQLYMQPLISAGAYTNFKEFAKPNTRDFNLYGENNLKISGDGSQYTVDPDGNGPASDFAFDNPDFNFMSLRGNAVLRWEYHPGSVFYFVWTQSRSDSEVKGDFDFGHSFDRLVNIRADNIFMLKFTYWFTM